MCLRIQVALKFLRSRKTPSGAVWAFSRELDVLRALSVHPRIVGLTDVLNEDRLRELQVLRCACAVLCCAVLCCAVLCCVVLCCAVLYSVRLCAAGHEQAWTACLTATDCRG